MIVPIAVEVVILPPFEVLVARVVMCLILVGLYGYDWWRVLDGWRSQGSMDRRHDGSNFRELIRSSLLFGSLIVILLGSINGAFFADDPAIREGLRYAGYALLGLLVVGGFGLVGSWARSRRRRA